jgi:hypothetical protein
MIFSIQSYRIMIKNKGGRWKYEVPPVYPTMRVYQLFIKTWTNLDNGLEPTVAAPVQSPCKNNIDQKFDRVWDFIEFLYHSFHRAGRAPRAASARAATCTATNGGEPLASARAGRCRVATTASNPRHVMPGTGAWMTCTRRARRFHA